MTIGTFIVGSELHGLAHADSDVDRVSIEVSSIREMLSPFRSQKPRQQREDAGDHTYFEFAPFVKMVTQGNATILEVAYSNHKGNEHTRSWALVEDYKHRLLDKDHIYQAHRGYAHSQLAHVYKDGIESRRGAKAACAYLRVLEQGRELLSDGTITFPLRREVLDVIYPIKGGYVAPSAEEFKKIALPFEEALEAAYHDASPMTPDYELAEWIIEQMYLFTDERINDFDI